MSGERRNIAGWSLRWNEERARQAYANGFWVRETLAEAFEGPVALLGITDCYHFAALWPETEWLASRGLVAFAFTQAMA